MIFTRRGMQCEGNGCKCNKSLRKVFGQVCWGRTRMYVRRNEDAILEPLKMCRDERIAEEVSFVEEIMCQLILVKRDVSGCIFLEGRLGCFGRDDLNCLGIGGDV